MLTSVKAWHLVSRGEQEVLGLLFGDQGGDKFELEALGDLVLQPTHKTRIDEQELGCVGHFYAHSLDVVPQHIACEPSLSESDTALLVGPLGLKVTIDVAALRIAVAEHSELDAIGGLGLNLQVASVDWAARRQAS